MGKKKTTQATPVAPTPATPTPATPRVKKQRVGDKIGKAIDAGIIQTKKGLHQAKKFAGKNKAALIAGGVGAAGLAAEAAALGHARGKRKAQVQNES